MPGKRAMEYTDIPSEFNDAESARFSLLLCFGKRDAVVSKWYFVVKPYELAVLLPENFLDEVVFLSIPCLEVIEDKSACVA